MRDYTTRAKALVATMTLEEKVSQMLHTAAPVARLGIPAYNWWNEALHGVARSGVATVFPQAVGLAAMFDAPFLKRIAETIAEEGRAKYNAYQQEDDRDIYKGLTFWSPNINIFRDPRWGRGHETYGEDPYLTGRLGVAFIEGLQGDDPDGLKSAACAKHFAVHSGPEGERHSFDAVVNDYDLWNTYLPAFEAAVKEANVEAVMGAYNRTNGEPCCGSQALLQDILRKKWGFTGHVTSDCWAIKDFHEFHKVTGNAVESVALAVNQGCDLNCGNLFGLCLQAVKEGLLTEETLDRAVTRLMVTRLKLGILPYEGYSPESAPYASIPYDAIDSAAHQALNREAARKSLVLLKNDGALPLATGDIRTIAVIGPNADSRAALEGNYFGTATEYMTVLGGLQKVAGAAGIRVLYAQGCHLYKDRISNISGPHDRIGEALAVARRSDAVVLCLGLDANLEGEEGDASNAFASGDKTTLRLPGDQQALLEKVTAAAGSKPVILVMLSGSALDMNWAQDNVSAIFQAFYPGAQGGLAVAEAIFGRFSPEGKLPLTFYKTDADLPDFRDYAMDNRTYRYFKGEPLYPFGYGLSYNRFSLNGVSYADGRVTATVKNEGTATPTAAETIQIYAQADGERENWNLCGFAKVKLASGETQVVTVPVSPTAFARYDDNGDLRPCPGAKRLYVGFTQPDPRSAVLTGYKPVTIEI